MIASEAQNPDAAWRLIEFQLSTDTQVKWNDFYNRLPKEAAESPKYLKNDDARKVQVEVAAYSQRIPAIHPAAPQFTAINSTMVNTVLSGQSSPRDALTVGARQVQSILDQWKNP
jgi:ABC-type glycerol-3-phosphate transport system substrate-binding protein